MIKVLVALFVMGIHISVDHDFIPRLPRVETTETYGNRYYK